MQKRETNQITHIHNDRYGEPMEATEPITPLSNSLPYREGVCIHCGQLHPLPIDRPMYDQTSANLWATDQCDCAEGERDRIAGQRQERYNDMIRIAHRKQEVDDNRPLVYNNARHELEQLFGEDAIARGKVALCPEVISWLHTTAMMVYDGLIGKMTVIVTDEDCVALACKKGVLSITAKSARAQTVEVTA